MKTKPILILCLSLFLSHLSVADLSAANECLTAKKNLESFFQKTENHCEKDSDCDGFFHRADSCQRAVILPKAVVTKSYKDALIKLQGKLREACAKELSGRGPCGPQPFTAVCKNKKCVDQVER